MSYYRYSADHKTKSADEYIVELVKIVIYLGIWKPTSMTTGRLIVDLVKRLSL